MNKKRKNFKRTSTIKSLPNVLLLTLQKYTQKMQSPNLKMPPKDEMHKSKDEVQKPQDRKLKKKDENFGVFFET